VGGAVGRASVAEALCADSDGAGSLGGAEANAGEALSPGLDSAAAATSTRDELPSWAARVATRVDATTATTAPAAAM
jgi:hypothetical protein